MAGCIAAAARISGAWLESHAGLTGEGTTCQPTEALPALPIEQIAPDVWFRQGISDEIAADNKGRIANLSFVIGDSVAVIDAGASRAEGQALYAAIRRLTDKPVSHLILTHMHPDHTLGASVFAEAGARVIGHPHLPLALEARAQTYLDSFQRIMGAPAMIGTTVVAPRPVPPEGAQIDLGSTVLTLTPVQTAHTDNDLTVHDSTSNTLFTGDLIFRALTPVVDGSLNGWLGWMDAGLAAQPARIVPGHGPVAASWDEAVVAQEALLTALRDETRDQIARGVPISEAVPDIARHLQHLAPGWAAFDSILPRDATATYKELEWE